MIHTRTELLALGPAKLSTLTYLPFYGHRRPPSAPLAGPWCLSQWWDANPFMVDGQTFSTAEHWMMYQKALLFSDQESARRVLAAPTPAAAKAIGRRVVNFDEATWVAHRFDITLAGNQAKFAQHPTLSAWLLNTRPAVLVEASPTDRIWGIGLSRNDPAVHDPHSWRGENLLGFVLMAVRSELTR